MFRIRYSYSDNYYATDGEDRGRSARVGNIAMNASQIGCSVHSSASSCIFVITPLHIGHVFGRSEIRTLTVTSNYDHCNDIGNGNSNERYEP